MEDQLNGIVNKLNKDAKISLIQSLLRDPDVRDAPELQETFSKTYTSSLEPSTLLHMAQNKSHLLSSLLDEPCVVRSASVRDVASFVKATNENKMVDALKTVPGHFSKILETAANTDVSKYASAFAWRLRNPGESAVAANELSRTDCLLISEALFSARRDVREACLSTVSVAEVVESTRVASNLPEFTNLLKIKIGSTSWAELRTKMEGKPFNENSGVQTDEVKPGVAELNAALNSLVKKCLTDEEIRDMSEEIACSVGENAKNVVKVLSSVQNTLLFR